MTRLAVGRPTLAVHPKMAPKAISEGLKSKIFLGGHVPHVPHPPSVHASRTSCHQSRAHWNPLLEILDPPLIIHYNDMLAISGQVGYPLHENEGFKVNINETKVKFNLTQQDRSHCSG